MLTCGFEELSLSVIEMEGNVKGVGWAHRPQPLFCMRYSSAKNHPFGNKLFTKNMYHYLSIAHI